MEMIKPVYLKNSELPQDHNNRMSDYELSIAASSSAPDLKCVQKDRDLWRLYVSSQESRRKLVCEGLEIRNINIRIYDTNPFSAGLSTPDEQVLKITVKGVPLSVDDDEVLKMLNKFNLSFNSDLKYDKIRHPETHKMTGILNGNRFIYVKALSEGTFLPRTSTCAGLKCFIYHRGQPSNKRTPYCTQCWEDSHFKKHCPNSPRCKVCKEEGHTPGDPACKHYTEPATNVVPFSGEKSCLSNFFPCDISIFGHNHKSAEHAYQYVKAMRSGDVPRASAIQSAKSALEAKKIGNLVTPSPLFAAEQVSLMTEIIEAKAVQVPVFADTLKAAKKSTVFAESTYDNFWASGLDVIGTSHTNAKHWPGRNTLGKILADMSARLRARSPSVRSASASRSKGKESGQMDVSQMIQDYKNASSRKTSAKKAPNSG